jgi:hypothetical protein
MKAIFPNDGKNICCRKKSIKARVNHHGNTCKPALPFQQRNVMDELNMKWLEKTCNYDTAFFNTRKSALARQRHCLGEWKH